MDYLHRAGQLCEEMIAHRRYLHQNAEVGQELPLTAAYVVKTLKALGYAPEEICQSGVVATVGKPGKTILIRAEMDALPMPEESGLAFASTNPCAAHTCGHDLHTAALLGAARMLKESEDELCGTVKLMFQPGEEIFRGANEMIQNGVLKNPDVSAAISGHVTPRYPTGTVAFREGAAMASCFGFRIHIKGRASHGASPYEGVDPINIAAHIYLSLQELIAREVSFQNGAILTIGSIHAGSMANTIPEEAEMQGTLRTFDNKLRRQLIERITCVVEKTAELFRGSARVEVLSDVPVEYNDLTLSAEVRTYLKGLFGAEAAEDVLMTGSDDFAYISEQLPAVQMFIGARDPAHTGSFYPGHHSKVVFDENAMVNSAALYADIAARWLREHP